MKHPSLAKKKAIFASSARDNASAVHEELYGRQGHHDQHGAVRCRADLLDPALLRAGRFDRKVRLLRPDTAARFEILKVTLRCCRLVYPPLHSHGVHPS